VLDSVEERGVALNALEHAADALDWDLAVVDDLIRPGQGEGR
jgi:hypothetical protein